MSYEAKYPFSADAGKVSPHGCHVLVSSERDEVLVAPLSGAMRTRPTQARTMLSVTFYGFVDWVSFDAIVVPPPTPSPSSWTLDVQGAQVKGWTVGKENCRVADARVRFDDDGPIHASLALDCQREGFLARGMVRSDSCDLWR
jgi:hypothetical protein